MPLKIWHADVSDENTRAENEREMRDLELVRKIGEHVERKYPGYYPKIEVDSAGGIIRLYLPHLLPPTWGYTVKLAEFNSDPGMRCITRGFGELMERFNQPRGRISRDDWRQAARDYYPIARGLFDVEVNVKTGRVRKALPAELAR